ncbi:class I SAM-dependent methyltransferase [Arsukibacterium sp.]|uniref:class I SAM-dependent methyltransferase n=1 Tax=Arsukibacterium sp. TaxID=1977258 RepID=UPI001BD5904E|nr:class I SAM-dependent methyltransferase [Arsukibacterium sp.]
MAKLPALTMLEQAGFITPEHSRKLADRCRDDNTAVYTDSQSGVIFLDPEFGGKSAEYYSDKAVPSSAAPRNDMDLLDTARRSQLLQPYIAGKRWLDFGCGPGYQLRRDSAVSSNHLAIELNKANRELLLNDGFRVTKDLNDINEFVPDVISLFHVMEHLTDPLAILTQLNAASASQSTLIVEVPHARDWLICHGPKAFQDFTFWSEHLVLHTRQTLSFVLQQAGWQIQHISAVQRYPVWNHLQWCLQHKPTGVNATSHDASSIALHQAYEHYLAARDQTDTLVAIAKRIPQ